MPPPARPRLRHIRTFRHGLHQPFGQIARQEGRVGGKADHMADLRVMRRRMLQARQDPGQRPREPVDDIGNDRKAEPLEPRGIAVSVDHHRRPLGNGPRDDMGQKRPVTKHDQVLVAAAHASRLAAGKKQAERGHGRHISAPRHRRTRQRRARAAATVYRPHPRRLSQRQRQSCPHRSAR